MSQFLTLEHFAETILKPMAQREAVKFIDQERRLAGDLRCVRRSNRLLAKRYLAIRRGKRRPFRKEIEAFQKMAWMRPFKVRIPTDYAPAFIPISVRPEYTGSPNLDTPPHE